jgi:hypothetical protein
MKTPLLLLLATAALSFPSCVITMLDVHPHQVPFDETEFAAYDRPGSGAITGQLAVVDPDNGRLRHGDRATVELLPVASYTTEMVNRQLGQGTRLFPADSRLKKYVRTTTTDHQGNFAFSSLPAGDYYVFGDVEWNDQPLFEEYNQYQWGCERITVRNGQVTRVMVSHNLNHGHAVLAFDKI